MLVIELKEENNQIVIVKYEIKYPFSLYTLVNSGKNFLWNLNSIEYKNIKNSFRISYAKKMNFTNLTKPKKVINGTITVSSDTIISNNANKTQVFLHNPKELIYIDEKNPYASLNDEKRNFPYYLFMSHKDAQQSLQFFIDYEHNVVNGEEIKIYLNLFEEENE